MGYSDLLQEQDNQCVFTDRNNYLGTNRIQQTNIKTSKNQKIENAIKILNEKGRVKTK